MAVQTKIHKQNTQLKKDSSFKPPGSPGRTSEVSWGFLAMHYPQNLGITYTSKRLRLCEYQLKSIKRITDPRINEEVRKIYQVSKWTQVKQQSLTCKCKKAYVLQVPTHSKNLSGPSFNFNSHRVMHSTIRHLKPWCIFMNSRVYGWKNCIIECKTFRTLWRERMIIFFLFSVD